MTPLMLYDLVSRGVATRDQVMWWLTYVELLRWERLTTWKETRQYDIFRVVIKPAQSEQKGGSRYA